MVRICHCVSWTELNFFYSFSSDLEIFIKRIVTNKSCCFVVTVDGDMKLFEPQPIGRISGRYHFQRKIMLRYVPEVILTLCMLCSYVTWILLLCNYVFMNMWALSPEEFDFFPLILEYRILLYRLPVHRKLWEWSMLLHESDPWSTFL